MKTVQEILDFYGVELNKIYKRKDIDVYFKIYKNYSNELTISYSGFINSVESDCMYGGLVNSCCIYGPISLLNTWDFEEYKEPILDTKEKEYLRAIIKPFKNRVMEIAKIRLASRIWDYISIKVESLRENDVEFIELPIFKVNSMYKGMDLEKSYTLEDLDL